MRLNSDVCSTFITSALHYPAKGAVGRWALTFSGAQVCCTRRTSEERVGSFQPDSHRHQMTTVLRYDRPWADKVQQEGNLAVLLKFSACTPSDLVSPLGRQVWNCSRGCTKVCHGRGCARHHCSREQKHGDAPAGHLWGDLINKR